MMPRRFVPSLHPLEPRTAPTVGPALVDTGIVPIVPGSDQMPPDKIVPPVVCVPDQLDDPKVTN